MVDVQTEIEIACSRDQVAEYATNPDNAPSWYVNINSVEWKSSRPLRLGSLIAFKAKFLGKDLSYVYEIAVFEPGVKLVMRTADGPFPMETTYEFESIEKNRTKMKLRNKGNPKGFSKLLAPFMEFAMRSANKKDLLKIKGILESDC